MQLRNQYLSLRNPKSTSLARATSFKPTNVDNFFENLDSILDKYKFNHYDIYNIDETGATTVHRPDRIVASKGTKQVGTITSAKRVLVTVMVAVSASGTLVPPMFVFPRAKFRDYYIANGPYGCVGFANPSCWMKANDFLVFMQHFVAVTKCSKEHPVLILLDNRESHLSIALINYYRDNGIVLLTLPSHCSHKLQPLDRTVFGPFKKYVNTASDDWMKSNPGKTTCIYDIPGIVKKVLPFAATPTNVQKGFKVCGICSFDREIFSADDFLASSVTDRPDSIDNAIPGNQALSVAADIPQDDMMLQSTVECSNEVPSSTSTGTTTESEKLPPGIVYSPQAIQPHSKAGPRVKHRPNRKKRRSAVVTSTPEKNTLPALKNAKNEKKPKPTPVQAKPRKRKSPLSTKVTKTTEWYCLVCGDSYSSSAPGEEWV